MALPAREIRTIKASPSELGFTWNRGKRAYFTSAGDQIPARQVRQWTDLAIANSKQWSLDLTQQFKDRKISFESWITQMRDEVKGMHTALAQIGIGGTRQWGPADAGRLGARLRQQYDYLTQLGLQVESGHQLLDGTLDNRVGLFIESGRGTYEGMRRGLMADTGMTEEMRVLHSTNSCIDCPPLSDYWAPIGTLPGIGESQCVSNCACTFEYR